MLRLVKPVVASMSHLPRGLTVCGGAHGVAV